MAFMVINMLHIDKDTVTEFFATFSRFEYSLKRSGFHRQEKNNAVEAHWDRFENELTKLDIVELAPILTVGAYLTKNPPKKQTLKNGVLDWDDAIPIGSDIKTLLIYVRRVRNNLFHGGKFPGTPVGGSERDIRLVKDSLAVLQAILELPGLPPGIRNNFLWMP